MEVIRDTAARAADGRPHAVTIGMFDGLHHGHRAVLGHTRAAADAASVGLAVVTFDPHPLELVRPDAAPRLLCGLEQKLELFDAAGVDTVMVVRFDDARRDETPAAFVDDVLVAGLAATTVVVGADFRFARNREGDVATLAELGAERGFTVDPLPLVTDRAAEDMPVISSTVIRRLLADGLVVPAAELLGRPHEIRGPVVQGDQRGRTIGFPTANVAVDRRIALPADGVYACWYERPDGTVHRAAVNIGKRPTFYENAEHSLVEAHLIDFEGDLYGEPARVRFVERLRGEQRFDGIEAIAAQLQRDVARAAEILAG